MRLQPGFLDLQWGRAWGTGWRFLGRYQIELHLNSCNAAWIAKRTLEGFGGLNRLAESARELLSFHRVQF